MKKRNSILLCIVMVFAMMVSVVGCGSDSEPTRVPQEEPEKEEKTIVGSWQTELDMLDMLVEALEDDPDMGDYVDEIDSYSLILNVEFDEDGYYWAYVDEDSFEDEMYNMMDSLLTAVLTDQAEAEGLTLDELLEMAEMSMDDLIEMSLEEADLDSMVDDLDLVDEGEYELDGDELIMDDEDVWTIKFKGNTRFQVTEMEDEEGIEDLLPITFKRM